MSTSYIAFLRAINVGGHTVKMETLRGLFEGLGFRKVETFIASGNIFFEAGSGTADSLERKIEKTLLNALGYEVATFLRTLPELAQIAAYKPFPDSMMASAAAFNVAFIGAPLEAAAKQKLMFLKNDIDDFHVHGREIYWLCRTRQSDSTFSNAVLERAIGRRATLRGVNTLQKMAAKHSASKS